MSAMSVQTQISASATRVWQYYTLPEHIVQWNAANDDWHCPRATNPLSVDSRFVWRMEAKDGSFGFDFSGVYLQIVRNKLIVYRLDDTREVSVEFDQDDERTMVKIMFEPDSQQPLEFQQAGWQAILDNFAAYVTNQVSL